MKEQIIKFIGTAEFDEGSGFIFGKQQDSTLNMVAEVRGWGAIQNMLKCEIDAQKFQDDMGRFITDAINEKCSNKDKLDGLIEWINEILSKFPDDLNLSQRGLYDGYLNCLTKAKQLRDGNK